jgi:hypothetical protein
MSTPVEESPSSDSLFACVASAELVYSLVETVRGLTFWYGKQGTNTTRLNVGHTSGRSTNEIEKISRSERLQLSKPKNPGISSRIRTGSAGGSRLAL